MKNGQLIVSVVFILLSVSLPTFGKILFKEDFEGDKIGQEPMNFEKLKSSSVAKFGDQKMEIVDDPEGKSGKTAEIFKAAFCVPKVAGSDDWTDWYWEWDWRWDTPCNAQTAYRIIDPSNFFHFSPRSDEVTIGFWHYLNDVWVNVLTAQFPHEVNTWYRVQIIMQGDKHTARMKERQDQTPFDRLEPAIELEDGTFEKGAVTVMGAGPEATSWIDNFVVYEDPKDVLAVDRDGKLTITWGKLKAE